MLKTISVPKTKEALERLSFDECGPDDLIEVNLSQEQFDALWSTGIFAELNEKLDLLIDDYEEEEIIGRSRLRQAQVIVALAIQRGEETEIMTEFKKLIDMAIDFKTGVFFFF